MGRLRMMPRESVRALSAHDRVRGRAPFSPFILTILTDCVLPAPDTKPQPFDAFSVADVESAM